MTGIILSGGKSKRMGCNKAFIRIKGISIIERQIRIFKTIFKEIIIVTDNPDKYKLLDDIKIMQDIILNSGPLGGIYTGLSYSNSFYNFIIACDMPFLNPSLIEYMIKNQNNYDAVIPKINNKLHPLFGIYSKDCLPIIEDMLKNNNLKVSDILFRAKTHFILKEEIERFDKDLASLININDMNDLAKLNLLLHFHMTKIE